MKSSFILQENMGSNCLGSQSGGQWMRKKGMDMKAVHTKSVRREIQDRVLSLPSKPWWVDSQGRRISAFQGPPLQGKALELLVHLLLTLKSGEGVDTSGLDVFPLTAIMKRGLPKDFPYLEWWQRQMCQSVMNTLGKGSCCKTLCSLLMVMG